MKTFNVYRHPQGTMQAVGLGWSWLAFLFGPLWAIVVGLSVIGVGTAAAIAVFAPTCGALFQGSDEGRLFVFLVGLSVQVIYGAAGNKWIEKKLRKKGYEFVGTVDASNAEGAIAKSSKPAGTKEPEIEIIEDEIEQKVHIRCTKCGLDQNVSRSKFGDRSGNIRIKCPKCKEPVAVTLGK